MAQGYELAQVNIGRLNAPIGSAHVKDFVDNLDRINALAEEQQGFVWRLTGDGNNATDIHAFDDPAMQINLSVWRSLDDLAAFVYRTAHRDIMRRRREWFEEMQTYMALWWVSAGHRPDPAEARERLALLETLGPTAEAFTFRQPFPAPDTVLAPPPVLETCD
jgi:hypothetical protein